MNKSSLDYTLKIRVPLILFVAAASFTITFFVSRAERDSVGYAPMQPIAFSHKLHAGTMGIDCQYCHSSASVSRHAGIPPVSTCMGCHTLARKNKPDIVKLTKAYDEGVCDIKVIISTNWESAIQYIIDRPDAFDRFLPFLRHPSTVAEFEAQMRANYLDGDSWPEIRLREIDTVYQA